MTVTRSAAPPSLPAGYIVERELGGGGMARVLLAREVALDRRVVVKVLPAELVQGLSAERFAREIAVAARLQDPHIVPVLTAGTTPEGLPYYTMPFIDGESLRARLVARPAAEGPLPMADCVAILRDVARALEYAHARGVVHRDIKPENVLLAGRGALVADFGIAKAMADARTFLPARKDEAHASAGAATGTPAYMAPEQAAGRTVSAPTDLYAWGVVAWELLAGHHPYSDRSSARELMNAHVSAPMPSLSEAAPHVPAPLAELVMQCLEKAPRDRPASATVLLEGLAAATDGAGGALLPATRRIVASGRTVRVRRAFVAGGVAALMTLTAVVAWQQFARSAAAPVVAEARARSASLAVLPFEHQGSASDAYFTEGIADEIRGRLAGVPDLVVIARASSEQYRGSTKTPRQMAEELGVRWLLTGTVQVLGSGDARRVLVRPELVEVPGDGAPRSRWGEPFDAQGGDVLRVQGEIAARVVDAMEVAVTRTERERVVQVASRDAQAYDAYLRGQAELQYGADVGPEAQARAITRFEEAVARDSLLLEAWVALARARTLLYVNGRERTSVLARGVREAVERVESLDPQGARGYVARGIWQRLVARDYAAARRAFEAAAEKDPGDMRAAANLALLLEEDLGQAAASLPHFERARAIDPRNVIVWRAHARALAAVGRFDEARAAADRARALAPTNQESAQVRVEVELAAGDTVAARALLSRLLDELPPGRASLVVATTAGWLLDDAAARRQLAVDANAFDGDRAQWSLRRAELLAQRGDFAGARMRADSARPALVAAAARATSSALALTDAAMAEALAGRHDAARAATNRAAGQLREESGAERGSSWASSLYPIACAAARAGARDSAIAWITAVRSVPSVHTAARIRVDPCFAVLRGEPRLAGVLAEGR